MRLRTFIIRLGSVLCVWVSGRVLRRRRAVTYSAGFASSNGPQARYRIYVCMYIRAGIQSYNHTYVRELQSYIR